MSLDDLDDTCGPWCKHSDYGYTDHICGIEQYDSTRIYRINQGVWKGEGLGPPPKFASIWNDNDSAPSWFAIWIQYLDNLWKLDTEEPVSDYMFSFDGFRNNYCHLTDEKGDLCLPPKKYKPG